MHASVAKAALLALRGLDRGDPRRVRIRRGRVDDEDRDQVRDAHPDHRVGSNARELRSGAARHEAEREGAATQPVLDFQGRLPEEQVRADRGAEDGDQRHRVVGEHQEVWGMGQGTRKRLALNLAG